jgi:MazG family protein
VSDTKRLLDIMARLREPEGGCPWDVEQTFETIAPYTIEEAYEVDDAIRRGDLEALRDELGDLLLQVVFHAQMAQEAGHFDYGAVVDAVSDKLVRRHPHVFGDARIETADAQTDAWERQKAEERGQRGETSLVDGVAIGLPALLRAGKLLRRAARAGFPAADAVASRHEVEAGLRAIAEDPTRERFGQLLLAGVRLGHALGLEPEEALREAVARLEVELRDAEAARRA